MSRRVSGQSLVEMALIAPILILLVAIVIDLGRIFATWIAVSNSAREGAYLASASIAGSVPDTAIRTVAMAEGSGANLTPDATHIAVAYPSPDLVVVTVRSQFQPVAPMLGGLWAGGVPWISARAAFPLPMATSTGIPITPSTPIPSATPTSPPTATSTRTATPTGTPVPTNTAAAPTVTGTTTALPTPTRTPTSVPQIVLVQSKGVANYASAVSMTLNSTPVQGNLLVAIVSANDAASISIGGSGWSVAVSASGSSAAQIIYYKIAGASETRNVSASSSTGFGLAIQVFEYSGILASNPLDQAATGDSGGNLNRVSGPFTCGSVTTSQANELLIAGVANDPRTGTNVNNTWNSSFTELFDFTDASSPPQVLVSSAQRIVSASGTYQTGSNLQGGNGAGATRCQTATFRAAF